MSLSGRYRVYGEVYVDTGRDPQGVDGEVGEVGDGGHPEKPSRAHRAEHLTGSGVGRDDRASIGGDGPQGTALRATEQGADQEPRAPGAFGGGVDPLISRGRPGEQPVVSAGQQPPQPGGQQIEEVMPIHKNPGGLEASRQFVGRAVMPRAHTRRNDHDPRGGRRPRPDVGRRRESPRLRRIATVGHSRSASMLERARKGIASVASASRGFRRARTAPPGTVCLLGPEPGAAAETTT